MPEKGFTVTTYAAGASLATIALIYVFAPTYFIDNTPSNSSNPLASLTSRKNGIVGLVNAANDCFINSVLQALAGLGDLRIYLIRETHRRQIDELGIYGHAVPEDADTAAALVEGAKLSRRPTPVWKIEGLQAGLVTKGLKDMLDQLNERPIVKKTISAVPFVRVLETAFRQRISRQQQDAQEFLQIVAERLCDEYYAGRRARRYARRRAETAGTTTAPLNADVVGERLASLTVASGEGTASPTLAAVESRLADGDKTGGQAVDETGDRTGDETGDETDGTGGETKFEAGEDGEDEEEDKFPMEGKIESQIECLTCRFKPRPSEQTFCTLTLNVPQVSSTSLSACFDTMLKTEYIDDFKCEKCRLLHAKEIFEAELAKSTSEAFQDQRRKAIAELQAAIDTDPERPPPGVILPESRYAPKRRIARHFRVVFFPKVLAIHLSRSIYDVTSQKNSAKVAFPERLPLGGLIQQRKYKLLGLVTHKGSHHSGHYESFRRQTVAEPYSNPNTFAVAPAYSQSPTPTATTPQLSSMVDMTMGRAGSNKSPVSITPTVDIVLPAPTSAPRDPASDRHNGSSSGFSPATAESSLAEAAAETASLRSLTRSTLSRLTTSSRSVSRSGSRSVSRAGSVKQMLRSGKGGDPSTIADDITNGTSGTNGNAKGSPGADARAVENGKALSAVPENSDTGRARRKKRPSDRWWRISDEKVREASTREVLGMQREVYLLFYELERGPLGQPSVCLS